MGKGFSLLADPNIEFPAIKLNARLKKLQCYAGENMLGHKDAKAKDSISFFFRHDSSYLKKDSNCSRQQYLTVMRSIGPTCNFDCGMRMTHRRCDFLSTFIILTMF